MRVREETLVFLECGFESRGGLEDGSTNAGQEDSVLDHEVLLLLLLLLLWRRRGVGREDGEELSGDEGEEAEEGIRIANETEGGRDGHDEVAILVECGRGGS